MDSTLAAAVVGGACAIGGSLVSQLVLFAVERRKVRAERRSVALEFALVFLERCKLGDVRHVKDEEYYRLITSLACLPRDIRTKVIRVYQAARSSPQPTTELITSASDLQESIATHLA
jgi:hypothetical protein